MGLHKYLLQNYNLFSMHFVPNLKKMKMITGFLFFLCFLSTMILSGHNTYEETVYERPQEVIDNNNKIQEKINEAKREKEKCDANMAKAEAEAKQLIKQNKINKQNMKLKDDKFQKTLNEMDQRINNYQEIQNKMKREVEEAKKQHELLQNYPPAEFQTKWESGIHIAVLGETKSGKSSFINTIRDIKTEDELTRSNRNINFAQIDHGKECTSEANAYVSDIKYKGETVTFWDLPGCSTQKVPIKSYFHRFGIKWFHAAIVMQKDVCSNADSKIFDEFYNHDTPFLLVRNKFDATMDKVLKADGNGIIPNSRDKTTSANLMKKIRKKERASEALTDEIELKAQKMCQEKMKKIADPFKKFYISRDRLFFVSSSYCNHEAYEMIELKNEFEFLIENNFARIQEKQKVLASFEKITE